MARTITVSEEASRKKSLLSLAGAWSDMSDSEEEELVKEIRQAWQEWNHIVLDDLLGTSFVVGC